MRYIRAWSVCVCLTKARNLLSLTMLKLVCLVLAVAVCCHARQFTFVNNHGSTIWVGSLGNAGKTPINGGGWAMGAGASMTLTVPDSWAGRFWARTGCSFDANGNGPCATGDCGNKLKCNGAGGAPPATLAEITLNGAGGLDYYDISNVDGFNVPVSMTPTGKTGSGYSCTQAACNANIDSICPNELKLVKNGKTVGCKSACLAFNTDQYCCRGAYGTPAACKSSTWPKNYPAIFKNACPKAYSYAYDDQASTFTCSGTPYKIVFG